MRILATKDDLSAADDFVGVEVGLDPGDAGAEALQPRYQVLQDAEPRLRLAQIESVHEDQRYAAPEVRRRCEQPQHVLEELPREVS